MSGLQIFLALLLVAIGAAIYYLQRKPPDKAPAQKTGAFTSDLTELARQGKLEPVVGVDELIERVLHVIARKSKNNPLLIGEPGVGKTAIVEGLAQRIAKGDVPEVFKGKRVLALNLGDLMAGTRYRGELEQRLRTLLQSLESEPRKIILFIDELHMIEQARGSEGSLDLADILKPALSRGEIQIVGATTWREYEKYLKPDEAMERRFQPVLVEEPTPEVTKEILRGVKHKYEEFHHVCIPEDTIEAAVDSAVRLIKARYLPDKAFDVIDEACAKVAIEATRQHGAAFGVLHAAASERAKQECGGATSIVTPEDVEEVAKQWHEHRRQPQA